MTRSIQALLLGAMLLPSAFSFGARAADLDYSYAPPPPPPMRYERPVAVEAPQVVVERPLYPRPFYRRPYIYLGPYADWRRPGWAYRRFYADPHRYPPYAFRPRPYDWYR